MGMKEEKIKIKDNQNTIKKALYPVIFNISKCTRSRFLYRKEYKNRVRGGKKSEGQTNEDDYSLALLKAYTRSP